jgi:uncharacterized SAM-binding protein YcdF (DUF218 family)
LLALLVLAVAAGWPLAHAGTALVVERDVGPPDAIIMLASHEWERLPAASALARRHRDAIVMLTFPVVVTEHNCHMCGERGGWLVEEGVERERIRYLPRTTSTYGEALAARRHARLERFSRLVIVTSPYHTRRALATFAKVFEGSGVTVGVAPASPAQGHPPRWWLDPYDRHYVRYEWAALLTYRIKYGVALGI